MYMRKEIHCSGNGLKKMFSVKVPRLGPPRNVLEPVMRQLKDSLGVQTAEEGLVAFLQFAKALAKIVSEDPGHGRMPPLQEFKVARGASRWCSPSTRLASATPS